MNKKTPNSNLTQYYCKDCEYKSSNKKDYKRHLTTAKHKRITNDYKKTPIQFICEFCCNKSYKYRQNLYRHKKKCKEALEYYEGQKGSELQELNNNSSAEIKTMLKSILNKNNLLLEENKLLREKISTLGINNTTINNKNCNNNKYTINMFLNDKCKNAMNLDQFVEKLKITLDDLQYTKNNGYTKGLSNIFIKSLNDMEVTERPIHCTDQKRLQFYVKDEDKWDKDKENKKIDSSIKEVSKRQVKKLQEWVKANPDFTQCDKKYDEYLSLVQGISQPDDDKNLKDVKKNLGENIKLEKKEYI